MSICEIVVASGKGGTGKTFIASNLAYFLAKSNHNVIAIDADVEAPDLLLALGGAKGILWKNEYYGAEVPIIDYKRCMKCWKCIEACKFEALRKGKRGPIVDYNSCEGLGVCGLVCPVDAISFKPRRTGLLYAAYSSLDILIITGELDLGGKNSGRLVYELKRKAYDLGKKLDVGYLIVDAAPGIGCPVISSLVGASLLIIVVEPTPQSIKGAQRLLTLAKLLDIRSVLVLNKYDLNPGYLGKAASLLGVPVLGKIRYDEMVVSAYTSMTPILMLAPGSAVSRELKTTFERLMGLLT